MKAEDINKYIDKFINLRDEEPPQNKKITVFCDDGNDEVGFAENIYFDELGLTMLIAKKWILQSDLEDFIK